MSSALVKVERAEVASLEPNTMDEAWGLSDRLAKAYVIPEHLRNKPADVFAMVLYGRELGMTPMQSLVGIYSLKGKPGLYAETAVALVKSSPLCKYFMCAETSDQRATFETQRVGEPKPQSISFTIEQARQANLMSNPTWKNYPSEMLRARAAIELCRLVYPDVCKGMARLPEEIDEETAPPPTLVAPPIPPRPATPARTTSTRRPDGPTPEAQAKIDAAERQAPKVQRPAAAPPPEDAGPDPRAKKESGGPSTQGVDRTLPPASATAPRDPREQPKAEPEEEPTRPGGDAPAEEIAPAADDPAAPKPVDELAVRIMDAGVADMLELAKEAVALVEDRDYALDLVGDRVIVMLNAATDDAQRVKLGEAIRELPPRVQQAARPAYNAAAKRLMPPKA